MIEKIPYPNGTTHEGRELSQMNTNGSHIYRPNLCYEVVRVSTEGEKQLAIIRLLKETEGIGVICTATIKATKSIVDNVKQAGFQAEPYHNRLSAREREINRTRFTSGELKALITTDPLNLGIEKQDTRFIIHQHVPSSIEAYYQESERAGRDGNSARCILLFQLSDLRSQHSCTGGWNPRPHEAFCVYQALQRLKADGAPVSLERIQESASEICRSEVRMFLSLLKDAGLVTEHRGARFGLRSRGLSAQEVERMAEKSRCRSVADREKIDRMMLYGHSSECRWKLLLDYLSPAERTEKCGHCDNCLRPAAEQLTRSEYRLKNPFPHLPSAFDQQSEKHIMPGDIVRLPEHGEVKVKAVEGDKIVVSLPDGETKKFKQGWIITEKG